MRATRRGIGCPRVEGIAHNLTFSVVWVNVEFAEWAMARNPKNRDLKVVAIKKYRTIIERGDWLLTGEPIIFDEDSNLMDGQNRLTAVIQTGKPIPALVVWGVSRDVMPALNTGANRTAQDVLKMHELANTSAAASTVRWLESFRITDGFKSTRNLVKIDNQWMLDYALGRPEIFDAITYVSTMRDLAPVGMLAALYLLMIEANARYARGFFNSFKTGAHLDEGHPVLVLREQLRRNKEKKHSDKGVELAAWVVKAWNMYMTDRSVKSYRFLQGERFPDISRGRGV